MADLTIVVADVERGAGAVVERYIAGVTITEGQPVYVDVDGKAYLAIAGTSLAAATVKGVALNAALATHPVEIIIDGIIAGGMGTTEGLSYLLSGVAGGISPHSDVTTPSTGEHNSNIGVGGANGSLHLAIFNSGQQVA